MSRQHQAYRRPTARPPLDDAQGNLRFRSPYFIGSVAVNVVPASCVLATVSVPR